MPDCYDVRRGVTGSDKRLSATGIQPLQSEAKHGQPHDQSSRASAGSDRNIDQARLEPLGVQGTRVISW